MRGGLCCGCMDSVSLLVFLTLWFVFRLSSFSLIALGQFANTLFVGRYRSIPGEHIESESEENCDFCHCIPQGFSSILFYVR